MKLDYKKCFSSEQSGKEIKKAIPFIITGKRIKYRRLNLRKEVEELYIKNYKMLLKEIKEDLNQWKRTVFMGWNTQ